MASEPIQQVFENVLEASKPVQVTISRVDASNYEIEGQTPPLKHHDISPFKISLSPRKLGTLILVQDEIEGKSNSIFIDDLINNLGKQIQVCHSIYEVQEVNSLNTCTACHQDIYEFQFKSDNLCPSCFYGDYYGKLLRLSDGEYHGGHLEYPKDVGKIYLTEYYLIFAKKNKEPSKRWEIIIPLSSAKVELYHVERDKYGSLKEIVIPYTDENGLPQEPRFGGWRSGITEQLNEAVYLALVNAKKKSQRNVVTNTESVSDDTKSNADPLQILKIRLAKGEITIEEYEKTRKILE